MFVLEVYYKLAPTHKLQVLSMLQKDLLCEGQLKSWFWVKENAGKSVYYDFIQPITLHRYTHLLRSSEKSTR